MLLRSVPLPSLFHSGWRHRLGWDIRMGKEMFSMALIKALLVWKVLMASYREEVITKLIKLLSNLILGYWTKYGTTRTSKYMGTDSNPVFRDPHDHPHFQWFATRTHRLERLLHRRLQFVTVKEQIKIKPGKRHRVQSVREARCKFAVALSQWGPVDINHVKDRHQGSSPELWHPRLFLGIGHTGMADCPGGWP